ncbi:MAG TPA: hypothetical protein VMO47_11060 [Rhodothermales bacterium]|nr:hypothetical protein [Rhodothermales bacterium]
MRHILAVGGDPGGAAALAPVLVALHKDPASETRVLGYRQAIDVWARWRIAIERLPETQAVDPAAWIRGEDVDLLVTSTSVNGVDHERVFLRWAARASVPSVTVLDFGTNYAARFRDDIGGNLILPSAIAVMDERTKREMVAEGFPPDRLVVTGQPAFDAIRAFRAEWTEHRRRDARESLAAGASCRVVLFASQPLSQIAGLVGGAEVAVDERELLVAVARALEEIALSDNIDILLAVRPHPREHLRPQDLPRGERVRSVLWSEGDSWSAVLAADLIVGMTTVLLVEACLLGCVVASLQPGGERSDPVPTNQTGGSMAVYDLAELRGTLRECLINEERRSRLREANADWVSEGATDRVLALIARTVGEGASKV